MRIVEDDLKGSEIADLVKDHLDYMAPHSPPESRHALDFDGLKKPDVTFWTAWDLETLVGCGALKQLDSGHGEIKSMHTVLSRRGEGIALGILQHIVRVAGERGYHTLSLETGSMEAFAAARALYSQYGFVFCSPFATYREDPYSVFMTLELAGR